MISGVAELIKALSMFTAGKERIARDDMSRIERLYDYLEYTMGEKQVVAREGGVKWIESLARNRYTNIYAVDSSSRVIDTPYVFVALGASTAVNRFIGYARDYPDLNAVLGAKKGEKYKYIAIVPEVEKKQAIKQYNAEEYGVITKNPAGYGYTPRYSKYVILDELRLMLENMILEEILNEDVHDSYVLIDGPIYFTPPLVYQVNELHGVKDELLNKYVEGWQILVSKRIKLVEKLNRENNVAVLGIVKRLNRSIILSKTDPLRIGGRVNDQVYMSILSSMLARRENANKPFYLGPITYDPGNTPIELPRKDLYYIALPRRREYTKGAIYPDYVYYRVEAIAGYKDLLEPVIYDSLHSGSLLPLSILLADSRAKKLSTALVNYLLRATGIPSEATHQYISL